MRAVGGNYERTCVAETVLEIYVEVTLLEDLEDHILVVCSRRRQENFICERAAQSGFQ
jgi:hypothetical protein